MYHFEMPEYHYQHVTRSLSEYEPLDLLTTALQLEDNASLLTLILYRHWPGANGLSINLGLFTYSLATYTVQLCVLEFIYSCND